MQTNRDRDDRVERVVCTHFFSWSPIFIGAFVGLGLGFLLDLFGMGIGLSAYTTDADGATALAVGGFLGLIIGAIATMFTAGFAAGYFAGPLCAKRNFGVAYGFLAWSLSLFLMVLMASNMSMQTHFNTGTNMSTATTSQVATTSREVVSRIHPATDAGDTRTEKNVRAAGMLSLSMFIIFFIGAISACFGGYTGIHCWNKKSGIDTR